jgi:hypothetical protein|tara:strand:- start:365 stop:580 length:216 start_codon:yes stop_codon:yes gene_type:complete
MKDNKQKFTLTKQQMDSLLHKAEQHMVTLFSTGEIGNLLEEEAELMEVSLPSIIMDRDYFYSEFGMIIGEA